MSFRDDFEDLSTVVEKFFFESDYHIEEAPSVKQNAELKRYTIISIIFGQNYIFFILLAKNKLIYGQKLFFFVFLAKNKAQTCLGGLPAS